MCGRYRLSRRKQLVAEDFDATPGDDDWTPRYNIAPTQPVSIIRQHPKKPRRQPRTKKPLPSRWIDSGVNLCAARVQMNKIIKFLLLIFWLPALPGLWTLISPTAAHAKRLNLVTTTTDLAALTREVGGEIWAGPNSSGRLAMQLPV